MHHESKELPRDVRGRRHQTLVDISRVSRLQVVLHVDETLSFAHAFLFLVLARYKGNLRKGNGFYVRSLMLWITERRGTKISIPRLV
jgi:hypothetical protein